MYVCRVSRNILPWFSERIWSRAELLLNLFLMVFDISHFSTCCIHSSLVLIKLSFSSFISVLALIQTTCSQYNGFPVNVHRAQWYSQKICFCFDDIHFYLYIAKHVFMKPLVYRKYRFIYINHLVYWQNLQNGII